MNPPLTPLATVLVLALTSGETWLLRGSVALFVGMVIFCIWIILQVREASVLADTANKKANALDKRTATLEGKLRAEV